MWKMPVGRGSWYLEEAESARGLRAEVEERPCPEKHQLKWLKVEDAETAKQPGAVGAEDGGAAGTAGSSARCLLKAQVGWPAAGSGLVAFSPEK